MSDEPIYFLRHGQTEWNAIKRLQGHLDSPLTGTGRGHAAAQGRLLTSVFEANPDIPIFASPLGRVRETVQIALGPHGRIAETREDLKEITAGNWDGLLQSEIAQDWPKLFAEAAGQDLELYACGPGGDGFEGLATRVRAMLDELPRPCVVFSHGLYGKMLRGLYVGLDRAAINALPNTQGCIFVLEDGRERVLAEVP